MGDQLADQALTMFAIAWLFFLRCVQAAYPGGACQRLSVRSNPAGAAPCTAMVFVWSHLTKGKRRVHSRAGRDQRSDYTGCLHSNRCLSARHRGVSIPWDTLILSVVLFVVIRWLAEWQPEATLPENGAGIFSNPVYPRFGNITIIGLLLTLVIIFSFQGNVILQNPLHIVLIAIPLIIQTFLIFFIAYLASRALKLPHDIAAPAGMIGASNFFELAVAVAIALFGAQSPVALATIVGVLVEVPVMLTLVRIANNTKGWFPNE